jgi:hypothetical protein
MIDPSMVKVGENLDEGFADKLAGLQYDSGIRELQVARERLPRQGAQNLADIRNWFGQVLGAQKTATDRSQAATAAGTASVQDATKSIIASLGGSANESAGAIGAAGAEAVGTLGALGAVQDQYNSDIRPLLQGEAAAASTRERNLQRTAEQDLQNELVNLRGQRGQAASQALMGIKQYNAGLDQARTQGLLSVAGQNNSLASARAQTGIGIRQGNNALEQSRAEGRINIGQINNALTQALTQGRLGIAQSNNALDQAETQGRVAIAGQNAQMDGNRANALMQVLQSNQATSAQKLQALMQIKQYNNTLRQQRFGNQLALDSSKIAALMNGLKVMSSMQPDPEKPLSAGDVSGVIGDLNSLVLDDSGQLNGTYRGANPAQLVRLAQDQFLQYGIDPNKPQARQAIMAWLRQHGVRVG